MMLRKILPSSEELAVATAAPQVVGNEELVVVTVASLAVGKNDIINHTEPNAWNADLI